MTTPALAHQAAGGSLTADTLTLQAAARSYLRWLAAHGYAQNTQRSYGESLSQFLRYAAGVPLVRPGDVTVLALDGFFIWLQESLGLSTRAAAHRRTVLIGLWKWMLHEGLAHQNVAAMTWRIKYTRSLPRYLEPHQVHAFLRALAAMPDRLGRRDYALAATLFYTGLRRAEASALRVDDVDLTAGRLRVRQGKGGRDRTLVLPPALVSILTDYLRDVRPQLVDAEVSDLFFLVVKSHGRKGGRWRRPTTLVRGVGAGLAERSIFYVIRDRARQILGIRLTPHGLRHTCASFLLSRGVQLETIQRHLGHQHLTTTMIYLHVPQPLQADEITKAFG